MNINIEKTRAEIQSMMAHEIDLKNSIYNEILSIIYPLKEELVLKEKPKNYPCPDIVAVRGGMERGSHVILYRRKNEDGYYVERFGRMEHRNIIFASQTGSLTLLNLYEAIIKSI